VSSVRLKLNVAKYNRQKFISNTFRRSSLKALDSIAEPGESRSDVIDRVVEEVRNSRLRSSLRSSRSSTLDAESFSFSTTVEPSSSQKKSAQETLSPAKSMQRSTPSSMVSMRRSESRVLVLSSSM